MVDKVLVVGAGFAGACVARELAESGIFVDVIDRRDHIAGNAFDFEASNGVRVHKYGPHLFHTNNERVVQWLNRFSEWIPYSHRVNALMSNGTFVPLPINRTTINTVFNLQLCSVDDVQQFLSKISLKINNPKNAAEYLMANIGRELTDTFFRPYTRKMWAINLEDLDASVVQRIPIRYDDEEMYFPNDKFQMLPKYGYSELFNKILNHERIRVHLNTNFSDDISKEYIHCFSSSAIDEYFGFMHGPLPYRSIKFHHSERRKLDRRVAPTVNFTDDGPFTRETEWAKLPGHGRVDCDLTTVTREEPCDYSENGFERFYPVKTSDGRHDLAYQRYRRLSEAIENLTFIGRCGTYQYLDMHQVINQSLVSARKWLSLRK